MGTWVKSWHSVSQLETLPNMKVCGIRLEPTAVRGKRFEVRYPTHSAKLSYVVKEMNSMPEIHALFMKNVGYLNSYFHAPLLKIECFIILQFWTFSWFFHGHSIWTVHEHDFSMNTAHEPFMMNMIFPWTHHMNHSWTWFFHEHGTWTVYDEHVFPWTQHMNRSWWTWFFSMNTAYEPFMMNMIFPWTQHMNRSKWTLFFQEHGTWTNHEYVFFMNSSCSFQGGDVYI